MGVPSKSLAAACIMGFVCIGLLLPAFSSGQKEQKEKAGQGAEMIPLDSGRQPQVLFPHHLHQEATESCSVCHNRFPQKRGAIRALQEKGELARQEVMNQVCIACHREKARAGEASGPLSCNKCHARQ